MGGGLSATEAGEGASPAPIPRDTAQERLQHALTLAYRHLAKRDRTVEEVRSHLTRRRVDPRSVDGAVAELVELDYLDDARYAERYIEDRRRLDGWGPLRIGAGLARVGVDAQVVEQALAADPFAADEVSVALGTLEHRLGGHAPDGNPGRQKALRTLAGKGFPLETAYAAIRAYERELTRGD